MKRDTDEGVNFGKAVTLPATLASTVWLCQQLKCKPVVLKSMLA